MTKAELLAACDSLRGDVRLQPAAKSAVDAFKIEASDSKLTAGRQLDLEAVIVYLQGKVS